MKAIDNTEKSQTETIAFELDLPHPPEKVWQALTDPELLAQWLLPVVGLDLTPGTAFTFKVDPMPGWDGVVSCRLLEVESQRKLSYSWVVGDMDTTVTFTLDATSTGTQLSLVHSGFKPHQKQNFGGARYGWRMMTEKLIEVLGRSS